MIKNMSQIEAKNSASFELSLKENSLQVLLKYPLLLRTKKSISKYSCNVKKINLFIFVLMSYFVSLMELKRQKSEYEMTPEIFYFYDVNK